MSESKKLYVSVGSRCAMKAAVGSELIMLIVLFSFAASSGIMESLLMVIQSVGYFNIAGFAMLSIIFSHLLGKKAGKAIHQNRQRCFYISYRTGLLVVVYSTLTTSLLALGATLVTTGLPADWFMLYIAKPLAWMTTVSSLPVLIAGSWYGFTLSKSAGE